MSPSRVLRLPPHWLPVASAAALACSNAKQSPVLPVDPSRSARDAGSEAGALPPPLRCGSADAGGPRPASSSSRGPALSIGELIGGIVVPIRDEEGSSEVDGTAVLIQSRIGDDGPITSPAALTARDGKVCLSGNTVIVPGANFGDYWGAEIDFFLKRPLNLGVAEAGTASAAGADGGPSLPPVAPPILPWDPAPGHVVGFSFVVEGNDPTLACGGLPPLMRLEGTPAGGNLDRDIYCHELRGLVSGETTDVLFSDITRECWEPGGPGLLSEPRPAGFTGELLNLAWLVPADETNAYAFDLCVSDIRPILGN